MNEEYELVVSPLGRKVTLDGVTVAINIFRGGSDPQWFLEIENQSGGSAFWEDGFATDQAALEEAMLAIETDGISSFDAAAR